MSRVITICGMLTEKCIDTFYSAINTAIGLLVAKKFVSCNTNFPPWLKNATKKLVVEKKIAHKNIKTSSFL